MTSRLPTRATEIWRGLGALAALGLLLVAVPLVLYAVGGSPLPKDVPAWSQVTGALMRPDTDHRLFLGAVRLIGWAAWCPLVIIIVAETAGYLAGRPTLRLPAPARPMQYLARDLVAMVALLFSTTTAVTNPAASSTTHAATAETTAVPSAATPDGQNTNLPAPGRATSAFAASGSEHRRWRFQVVKQGDTLWGIARRELGSGTLYPKIFLASRELHQPQGLPRLVRPDRIFPGQRVRIPQRARKNEPRPPAPSLHTPREQPQQSVPAPTTESSVPPTATPAPSQPPRQSAGETGQEPGDRDAALAIALPTGTYIGIGLAAAISTAWAVTRLHRRRRQPHLKQWPQPVEPEPIPPTAISNARKAHLDTYIERGESIPTDADLIAADLAMPAPSQITVGLRDDRPVILPLSGLSLGLHGPGAPAVIRAVVTELVARSHRARAEVVIPSADAKALFTESECDLIGLATSLPGLTITSSLTAAITHLEAEVIHRARLMQATDEPDVPSLRTADPSEPLPALLIVASTQGNSNHVLQALLQFGHRYSIGGLILGSWPAGTSAHIAVEGAVARAEGPHSGSLIGARLFHVETDDAVDMLRTVRTSQGAAEPSATVRPTDAEVPELGDHTSLPAERNVDMPELEAPMPREQGRPIRLCLLGPVRLYATGMPVTTGLRRSAHDLLAYLALHPNGVTREQVIVDLWPDHDPQAGTTAFHTANNNIRRILRQATGLREPMFIIHAAGRYRLDPYLITVDLWDLTIALDKARQADNDAERRHALQPAAALYTGDFAADLTHEWAETHREYIRRTTTDALTHLADLTQAEHPEQALAILEQALDHDPYSEPLYRTIMRLQADLDRPDAVRRTYQLLESRLAAIDAEPNNHTHQLMAVLLNHRQRSR
ncbi:hypothetical protein DPM19_23415 [Actinomadura craniellae]|uniref:LysM domain-containing protein n=1 Tax=Actinomadura craniellae TaxID=2231787 RepID=A0A365H1I1_9ACTN|nr:BTAD domain-containing putative transcriptional regulator [Actinomadura craniellae]RAY12955.1 hypothetical protein DPM19_23415 [Actinomadura craniellae]